MSLAEAQPTSIPTTWGSRIGGGFTHGSAWLRAALGWQPLVLLAVSLVALFGAYQVERPIRVNIGGAHESPFVRNFYDKNVATDGTHYRWTSATSFVIFEGIGGGRARTATVRLRSGRPGGIARPVTVLANGVEVKRFTVGPEWQTIPFDIQGAATTGHGIVIELRTPAEKLSSSDSRVVGVQVNQLRMETVGGGWTIPAWGTLGLALMIVLALYLMAARAFGVVITDDGRRRTFATLGAAGGMLMLVALFIFARPYIAAYSGPLLAVLLGALGALLLSRPLIWLGARCGLAVTPSEATALCVILALGIIAKLGGLLYPDTIVIDLGWHVRWMRTFLRHDFGALYFPSDLSSGPKEWGIGILIPKSPLFYAMLAPFTLLPTDIGTVLKLCVGVMEVFTILFVFAILKRVGMGTAGIVAAFLYTVTPLSYLALSYGNYPTLFAQFLTVVAFALLLFAGRRLDRPGVFVSFVLVLALSLLAYPVVAAFNVCVLGAFGVWWWRQATDVRERRRALLILIGTVLAALLAFLSYYIQYVRVTLQSVRTLGTSTAANRGYTEGGLRGAPWHITTVIAKNIQVGNLLILLAIAITGVVLCYRAQPDPEGRRTWQFLLLWLLIMPVFTLADAYVDLILKPLFYTMVPIALFGGITIVWLWRRGRIGQVAAILCCTAITAQAWWLWFHRIAYAGQG
ncbi:MAG: hypothetical protein LC793_19980 [Thermomicrobia bacterium]|nr:hypothetical protein [Thermomicrobia bacterium]